ncbi:MAG: energy transducer TonB [Steroidobacteraceae bacterium]
MGVYTHTEGNWFSRRGTFLILLIAFHVLLLWALKSGFAIQVMEMITPPIKVAVIKEEKEVEPPPPPPPVKMVELPPISVPPVLVDIQIPVDAPPPQITITTAPPPPGPPAPVVYQAPPAPKVVSAYGIAYKPDVADLYPPSSIQMEEQGKPIVKVCWDAKGKVVTSEVAKSSGIKRLDDAAIKYGKQMRFKPGISEGVATGDCANQPVVFSLK